MLTRTLRIPSSDSSPVLCFHLLLLVVVVVRFSVAVCLVPSATSASHICFDETTDHPENSLESADQTRQNNTNNISNPPLSTDPNLLNHRMSTEISEHSANNEEDDEDAEDNDDADSTTNDQNYDSDSDSISSSTSTNETFLSSESRPRLVNSFVGGGGRRLLKLSPTHAQTHGLTIGSRPPPPSGRKVKETKYYISAPTRHRPPVNHHHHQYSGLDRRGHFIPVAAYSITKRKPNRKRKQGSSYVHFPERAKMSASTVSMVRQRVPVVRPKAPNTVLYTADNTGDRNPNDDQSTATAAVAADEDEDNEEGDNEDDYELRKESAVYGYIHKPEVIEFRGQYYYGNNQDQGGNGADVGGGGGGGGGSKLDIDGGGRLPAVEAYEASGSGGGGGHEHYGPIVHERHRVSYMPPAIHEDHYIEPSTTEILFEKLKKVALFKGITAKGLLLASIPLFLSPLVSYFLTPVVIPITANVAAGRRRRRRSITEMLLHHSNHSSGDSNAWTGLNRSSILREYPSVFTTTTTTRKPTIPSFSRRTNPLTADVPEQKLNEAQILLAYMSTLEPDERMASSALASFLECDGLFLPADHCLEQLACHFSDGVDDEGSDDPENQIRLERAVTSVILSHLLQNEFVSNRFRKRLKLAAAFGRRNGGHRCARKYPCDRVHRNRGQSTKTKGSRSKGQVQKQRHHNSAFRRRRLRLRGPSGNT